MTREFRHLLFDDLRHHVVTEMKVRDTREVQPLHLKLGQQAREQPEPSLFILSHRDERSSHEVHPLTIFDLWESKSNGMENPSKLILTFISLDSFSRECSFDVSLYNVDGFSRDSFFLLDSPNELIICVSDFDLQSSS